MSYNQLHEDTSIDVICQFTKDGIIIPLKIRIPDDEGELQVYKVKAYKEIPLITGMRTGTENAAFECRIEVYGCIKTIQIYYTSFSRTWKYKRT